MDWRTRLVLLRSYRKNDVLQSGLKLSFLLRSTGLVTMATMDEIIYIQIDHSCLECSKVNSTELLAEVWKKEQFRDLLELLYMDLVVTRNRVQDHLMNEFVYQKGSRENIVLYGSTAKMVLRDRIGPSLKSLEPMLADSLLPIQFWAEAIPTLGFMRPFGCLDIINFTLDQLEVHTADKGSFLGPLRKQAYIDELVRLMHQEIYCKVIMMLKGMLLKEENRHLKSGRKDSEHCNYFTLSTAKHLLKVLALLYIRIHKIHPSELDYWQSTAGEILMPASIPLEAHKSLGKDDEGEDVDSFKSLQRADYVAAAVVVLRGLIMWSMGLTDETVAELLTKAFPQWKYLVHVLLHCLSPKSTSWEQFGTNISLSSLVGLATQPKVQFFFDDMNAEEAHSTSSHSRAASSPRDAQGTPTQSVAQASIHIGTANFQVLDESSRCCSTDFEDKSDETEQVIIEEEKDTSDVKSGDTEELDWERILSPMQSHTSTAKSILTKEKVKGILVDRAQKKKLPLQHNQSFGDLHVETIIKHISTNWLVIGDILGDLTNHLGEVLQQVMMISGNNQEDLEILDETLCHESSGSTYIWLVDGTMLHRLTERKISIYQRADDQLLDNVGVDFLNNWYDVIKTFLDQVNISCFDKKELTVEQAVTLFKVLT
ncbi:hypothetical protein Tco_1111733 [Tanacetum coccineum]|uniref:Uncharacterized protein n=1 Tax=Tanacetum coccineum TaxID=301880 RepID=A0ABQ5IMG9_9ASTR